MADFTKQLSIRWSDLDPNFHLRHTAYYDFGAQVRVEFLEQIGLTTKVMQEQKFGPVLFREECIFKREIRYVDKISINIKLKKAKRDFSRFSIQHELIREDGTLCAILTVDGAWIDTTLRKLTIPPQIGMEGLKSFPTTEDFQFID